MDAALEYLLSHISEDNFNVMEFENFCGIGVTVSPEQVERAVEKQMAKYKQELLEKRYRFNSGIIMQAVRAELKWADGKAIQNEVAVQVCHDVSNYLHLPYICINILFCMYAKVQFKIYAQLLHCVTTRILILVC